MVNTKLQGKIRERGMTQADLAAQIGMTPATLSRKIRANSFGLQEVEAICAVLDVKPWDIFFNEQRS